MGHPLERKYRHWRRYWSDKTREDLSELLGKCSRAMMARDPELAMELIERYALDKAEEIIRERQAEADHHQDRQGRGESPELPGDTPDPPAPVGQTVSP